MDIETTIGLSLDSETIEKYFRNLVNMFYKILPMREENEPSLMTYMSSLQAELLGCKSLIKALDNDPSYTSLLFILQFLIDNTDADHAKVRREIFRAISICNKIADKYSN